MIHSAAPRRPTCDLSSAIYFLPMSDGCMLHDPRAMSHMIPAAVEASEALQIFDQVVFVRIAEFQLKMLIVMVNHVEQSGETAIVEKAALLMRPQSC